MSPSPGGSSTTCCTRSSRCCGRDLVQMVLDGERLVGFGIVLPDLNPQVQKLDGRLNPWDKLWLLYHAKFAPVRKPGPWSWASPSPTS